MFPEVEAWRAASVPAKPVRDRRPGRLEGLDGDRSRSADAGAGPAAPGGAAPEPDPLLVRVERLPKV